MSKSIYPRMILTVIIATALVTSTQGQTPCFRQSGKVRLIKKALPEIILSFTATIESGSGSLQGTIISPTPTVVLECREVRPPSPDYPTPSLVIWDSRCQKSGYIRAGGNKGHCTGYEDGDWYVWLVEKWKKTDGHYADLRFCINNGSRDLRGYTRLIVTLVGKKGMTIEAFLGSGGDSQQGFLQDIHGDESAHTYEWDITSFNRSNIRNVLWLHVPTWKNTNLANHYRLWMCIDQVVLAY